ncbi:MAG: SWIM zinc finger family protein [Bdellovibrio sp.]|nr:SWIM zinc finger family protein [Bdellovibrio sp.]
MAVRQSIIQAFKAEVQNAGAKLIAEDAVILTVTSDTAINALVRAGTPARVSLTSTAISSPMILASCSCTRAKKNILCKHIWAVLQKTDLKHPDFLDAKADISIKETAPAKESPQKAKEDEFKKLQAERLKARNKEKRLELKAQKKGLPPKSKNTRLSVSYPPEVHVALDYFKKNGFEIETPLNSAQIQEARRQLSRIFHPDKGGSHEEVLELNQHYDLLVSYSAR